MKFKFKHTDKVVGAFVFLSLFTLTAVSIILLINKNNRLFEKKHYFYTRFTDAKGLVNKDIVFKGFNIGKIKSVKLLDDDTVQAAFFIFDQYISRVTEGSVLNRSTSPIGGSMVILIKSDYSTEIIQDLSYLPSLDTPDGQELLAKGLIKKDADQIATIINRVDKTLVLVNSILASIDSDNNASDNSIARILVNTGDIVENLSAQTKKFDTTRQNLDEITANFKDLSYQMRDPDNMVRRLIDPEGDVMFDSIQASLENLTHILENIETFSSFINTQENQIETLLIDSRDTIKEAKAVLIAIKNNPLLKAGVPEKKEQVIIKEKVRDRDF